MKKEEHWSEHAVVDLMLLALQRQTLGGGDGRRQCLGAGAHEGHELMAERTVHDHFAVTARSMSMRDARIGLRLPGLDWGDDSAALSSALLHVANLHWLSVDPSRGPTAP